jgi:hypothetical protein
MSDPLDQMTKGVCKMGLGSKETIHGLISVATGVCTLLGGLGHLTYGTITAATQVTTAAIEYTTAAIEYTKDVIEYTKDVIEYTTDDIECLVDDDPYMIVSKTGVSVDIGTALKVEFNEPDSRYPCALSIKE